VNQIASLQKTGDSHGRLFQKPDKENVFTV